MLTQMTMSFHESATRVAPSVCRPGLSFKPIQTSTVDIYALNRIVEFAFNAVQTSGMVVQASSMVVETLVDGAKSCSRFVLERLEAVSHHGSELV